MDEPEFPGAHPPECVSRVRSLGLELNVLEWGNPDADPLLLCHGMWDHARSFAALAPLLASRFRVLALDARGHGDSDWADAYNWEVEVLDVVHVLRWIGRPTFLVGHSMGGGQATDAACGVPHMVRKLVNIDGFGPPPFDESATSVQNRMAQYLERRRKSARRAWRPYASIDDLAERRQAQNPRLSTDWLSYFV
jgi:pimeloyl-ACP methyl ester carboxylesterase